MFLTEATDIKYQTTMLTPTQLILFLLLTDIGSAAAEMTFHSRDHSDVETRTSHHADLIVDKNSARLFLSKYGFLKPVSWEQDQNEEDQDEEAQGGILSDKGLLFLIQEGPSSSRARAQNKGPTEDPDFTSALKQFQSMSGLPVTGMFDDATKAAMNKPRCGVPDGEGPTSPAVRGNSTTSLPSNITARNGTADVRNNIRVEQEPGRAAPRWNLRTLLMRSRVKRETDGFGHMAFPTRALKWRLIGEGFSSQLSIDEQRYIFKLAFRMWSEVSPLEFQEDVRSPLAEVDIRLGFGTGRHLGCSQVFDGAGQEFAHAWFLGDIHFDDDEHFTAPSTGNGISLLKVAVHEIGHVLGLPHIYRPGSIMQPNYLPQDAGFEIDWLDRKAIQQLYGRCRGRFSAVFDWIRKEQSPYGEVMVRFNTYFMREGWYWLYENRNNRTRYGDPVAVQAGWHGIPSNGVDAYVHVWTWAIDAAYFFKGTRYWRYDSESDQAYTEDAEGHRYPRLISEGFPGVPSPIDTAFFDRRDSRIYFFKGIDVYGFDVATNAVAEGYPKRMTEAFPAVLPGDHPGGHLDAAYFSYTHNTIFLLKGTRFWRLLSNHDRRRRPWLPGNGLLPSQDVDQQWFDICDVHNSALKVAG